jgi:hypothetical protein
MPTLQEISSSMCDVRKSVGRLLILALSAGLLAVAVRSAQAQITSSVDINKRKQEAHARRETNASRQARIARTVEDTYSHRYEVMGGGGFLRFRSGSRLKRNNEISWNTAFNYYFNPKLSVIGDAQGSFGHAKALTNNTYGVPSPQINEYFFMGGVSYRFYRKERVAISAQALGGSLASAPTITSTPTSPSASHPPGREPPSSQARAHRPAACRATSASMPASFIASAGNNVTGSEQ